MVLGDLVLARGAADGWQARSPLSPGQGETEAAGSNCHPSKRILALSPNVAKLVDDGQIILAGRGEDEFLKLEPVRCAR